jgi:hypothetical protein
MERKAHVTIFNPLPLRMARFADRAFTVVAFQDDQCAAVAAYDSALGSGAGSVVTLIGCDGETRFVSQPLSLHQLRAQRGVA